MSSDCLPSQFGTRMAAFYLADVTLMVPAGWPSATELARRLSCRDSRRRRVSGVGDDAIFIPPLGVALNVKIGSSVLQIRVSGADLAQDPIKQMEIALAREVIRKLWEQASGAAKLESHASEAAG